MNVLVAGGAKSLVDGNLAKKLGVHGITVGWHITDMTSTYSGIPKNCEGVIGVRDMMSHSLSGRIVMDAKSRGIPCVLIERKWEQSVRLLKMAGFPIKDPDVNAGPSETDVKAAAIKYLVQARSEGRDSSYEEVASYVKGRFGNVPFTMNICSQARAKAAANQPLVVVKKEDIVGDARTGALILLEDNPELILAIPEFRKAFQARFPDLAPAFTDLMAHSVIAEVRDIWKNDLDRCNLDGLNWMKKRFQQYKDTGTGWLSFSNDVGKPIFGRSIPWVLAGEARAHVYGSWARLLIGMTPAAEFFAKLRPGVSVDIGMEMDKGNLKYISVPTADRFRRYTSELAIQEFAEKRYPLVKVPNDDNVAAALNTAGIKAAEASPAELEMLAAVSEVVDNLGKPKLVDKPVKASSDSSDILAAAELIEAGIGIKINKAIDAIQAHLEAKMADMLAASVKLILDRVAASELAVATRVSDVQNMRATIDQEFEGLNTNVASGAEGMAKALEDLKAEIAGFKTIVAGLKVPVAPAAVALDTKAMNLGQSILAARGAEVHITFGNPNPKG